MFVPSLREIQERCGYLPREELERLSARLEVPLHRLHEVITFFPHFRLKPPPEVEVRVCRDQACHLRGAIACRERLEAVATEFGGPGQVKVEGASCLGRCDGAPAVLVECHRKGDHDRMRILEGATTGDYAARLQEIVRAHLGGREIPIAEVEGHRKGQPERVQLLEGTATGETATRLEELVRTHRDRDGRGWRIDPYKPSERYTAVRSFVAECEQVAADLASLEVAGQHCVDRLNAADLASLRAIGQGLVDRLNADVLRALLKALRPDDEEPKAADPAALRAELLANLRAIDQKPDDRLEVTEVAALRAVGKKLAEKLEADDLAALLAILKTDGQGPGDRLPPADLAALKGVGQTLVGRLRAADLAAYLKVALKLVDRDPTGEIPATDLADVKAIGQALVSRLAPAELARLFVGQKLIDQLRSSDLRGMGGAGRPAYTKWGEVRDEAERADATSVVCNGDESEPSTFKDRELLLRAPHLVVEGMILGALVVGAHRGYVYIRHEYFDQIQAIKDEIVRARGTDAVWPDMLGTGQPFELEVFESPGGYICGEQSALIEAIEERRAEPRNRPPVIEAKGLFNQPTLLNNVETFAWVPAIALKGGGWYCDQGIAESPWYVARRKPGDRPRDWPRGKGLRFFSICGDVTNPGVYEVPVGLTVGELIERAGKMRDGLPLLAFAPSGPSGGFLPATLTPADLPAKGRFPAGCSELSVLELPLDKAEFNALGLLLGAGLLVVADVPGVAPAQRVLDVALNATRFFRNESCGKCVPCRIGTQKLVLIGERLQDETTTAPRRVELLGYVRALQEAMEQTSICGLGTSASKPMASLYEHRWSGAVR
jgi:NADH:ubiquinone oxidoreductase subunit F (NADH-binding)/NADH:ubiquinone oxidoreductase subunit E